MDTISRAFQAVDRANFLPPEARSIAGVDAPIEIGYGQTNSQPSTVRLMLEWLDAEAGNNVLDVGSGSGWTTALLAYIVGPAGTVLAVERIPELVEFGQRNNERLGIDNTAFFHAGDVYGLPDRAPFDRILVSASAQHLPSELIDQLDERGRLVIPVRNDVLAVTKQPDGKLHIETHPGFRFVPLI